MHWLLVKVRPCKYFCTTYNSRIYRIPEHSPGLCFWTLGRLSTYGWTFQNSSFFAVKTWKDSLYDDKHCESSFTRRRRANTALSGLFIFLWHKRRQGGISHLRVQAAMAPQPALYLFITPKFQLRSQRYCKAIINEAFIRLAPYIKSIPFGTSGA